MVRTLNIFVYIVSVLLAGLVVYLFSENQKAQDRIGESKGRIQMMELRLLEKQEYINGLADSIDSLRAQIAQKDQEIQDIHPRYVTIRSNILRLNADESIRLLAERLSIPDDN